MCVLTLVKSKAESHSLKGSVELPLAALWETDREGRRETAGWAAERGQRSGSQQEPTLTKLLLVGKSDVMSLGAGCRATHAR